MHVQDPLSPLWAEPCQSWILMPNSEHQAVCVLPSSSLMPLNPNPTVNAPIESRAEPKNSFGSLTQCMTTLPWLFRSRSCFIVPPTSRNRSSLGNANQRLAGLWTPVPGPPVGRCFRKCQGPGPEARRSKLTRRPHFQPEPGDARRLKKRNMGWMLKEPFVAASGS